MSSILESGVCKGCDAPVLWVIGANGKRNPLNAQPREDGNIWIGRDGTARYRSKTQPIPDGATRYTSHFSDCPAAASFRRTS